MLKYPAINKLSLNSRKVKLGLSALAFTVAAGSVLALNGGVSQAAVGGPVCNVPADYPTISAAVAVPTCTTVRVAPGDYNESVVITREVKLRGAKSGVNVNSRTFDAVSESTIKGVAGAAVTVDAKDVVVDGFSITNPNQGTGVVVKTAGENAIIKNNIVDTIGDATFAPNTVGIYLETGPDSVDVLGNKINNIQSIASAQGILVGDSTSADPSLDTLIRKNVITNVTSTRGAYGIQLNNGARTPAQLATATGYTEATVISNTIKDLKGEWAHGIGLEGETPNVVVTYNRISNLTDINPTPIADAIAVFFEANQFFFTAEVNRNSLDVAAANYGIAVHPALTTAYPSLSVDGECNWWGAASGPGPVGPGSGSKVTTGVDFNPWLKSANLDGKCGAKSHGHYSHDHHHGHDKDDRYDRDVRDN